MLKRLHRASIFQAVSALHSCRVQSKSTISAIRYGIRKSEKESQSTVGQRSYPRRNEEHSRTRDGNKAVRNLKNYERGVSRHFDAVKESNPRRANELEISYTTAASEFLYGTSSVLSALKAGRRKFYKLYLAERTEDGSRSTSAFEKWARLRGVKVVMIKPHQTSSMDKASKGRPHNGVILETSPLTKLPVKSLGLAEPSRSAFSVQLGNQSQEEKLINGENSLIDQASSRRQPLVLMLDGILDPGNLGGIIRTAWFLGVDAVVVSTHNAPLGPVALKASSGAAESMPLLSVHSTGAFLESSKMNGWEVYAAVAPPSPGQQLSRLEQDHFYIPDLPTACLGRPCLLMLGGEGTGLKFDLVRKADFSISIGGQRSGQGDVDSLNVSVAAGLLCEAFLRELSTRPEVDQKARSPSNRDLF